MTNREKFKEVFGFTPHADAECVAPRAVCESRLGICANRGAECPFWMWWDKEYKPCFKLKEDIDRLG